MSRIVPLRDEDLETFARLAIAAYPGMGIESAAEQQNFLERLQTIHDDPRRMLYAVYRDGLLLGGMILYDFTMNFHGAMIPIGGVGMVAVDLLYKREKAARDMMRFFLKHYRVQRAPLVALYPFRPDFYRQMGFGYGTKMSRYEIRARALPRVPVKQGLRYLAAADLEAVGALYERYARRTHGMFLKLDYQLEWLFRNPKLRVVGYEDGSRLAGVLAFEFEKGKHLLDHKLQVREFVWEDPSAFRQLLNFIHIQADQSEWVGIDLTDHSFHHLLSDPRNDTLRFAGMHHEGNTQGVGLMYRVVDVPAVLELLAGRDTAGLDMTLGVTIGDDFFAANNGRWVVRRENGHVTVAAQGAAEVEVRLDVAPFSSLAVGSISFKRLHAYDLAEISDPAYVAAVDHFFHAPEPPRCLSFF